MMGTLIRMSEQRWVGMDYDADGAVYKTTSLWVAKWGYIIISHAEWDGNGWNFVDVTISRPKSEITYWTGPAHLSNIIKTEQLTTETPPISEVLLGLNKDAEIGAADLGIIETIFGGL